jgi:rare lipoprotein A
MTRVFILIFISLFINACAEVELASHMAKTIIPPKTPASKGTFKVGSPYKIKGKKYYPEEDYHLVETGIASWYGPNFHGKPTANGEIFDKYELTAAHRTLQMPSLVRVTNLDNGRSLVVRINDRGPYKRGRIIDLSERASELLGFKNQGTAKVKIEVLTEESKQIALAARNGHDTSGYEVALNRGKKALVLAHSNNAERVMPSSVTREPITKVSPDKTTVSVASLEAVDREYLSVPDSKNPKEFKNITPGHTKAGNFYPDPFITEMPVSPTQIYVQAGSFSVYDNADKLKSKLSSLAKTFIASVNVNGTDFHRVRLGPIKNVEEADTILERVISNGLVDAIIVVD